jgi:hypothetical protein
MPSGLARPVSLLALLAPGVLAFAGAALGHRYGRVTAREQERWRRREETMRLLRWAADAASEPERRRVEIGVTALIALTRSPLLDPDDLDFVSEVLAVSRSDV